MKTGVAYHDVRNPNHVREDLKDMVTHHCNFVVHTFSEADLIFYRRAMKEIVKASHDLGLEVYLDPWAVGGIFGGEALSRFVAENLSARQVLADGASVAAACMNSPEFRAFMKHWIEAAAEIGSDVVFWDEPRFFVRDLMAGASGRDWACRCPTCGDLFQERHGRAMPEEMDADVIALREATLVAFFSELCDHAKACGMKNALCVLPQEDAGRGVSDWETLAAIPSLDIFGTDPYWAFWGESLEPYVREKTRRAKAVAEKYGRELQMWVLAFLIQEGREDEVMRAAEIFHEEGVRNIAAWSYGGGGWTYARSQNPERVWENLGKVFGRLRSMSS
jgi:hypothetical protein